MSKTPKWGGLDCGSTVASLWEQPEVYTSPKKFLVQFLIESEICGPGDYI